MTSNEPNNCTIELAYGGTVHVIGTPSEIQAKINIAIRSRAFLNGNMPGNTDDYESMVMLERSESEASRPAHGWPYILLHPDAIAGVFPIQSRSEQ